MFNIIRNTTRLLSLSLQRSSVKQTRQTNFVKQIPVNFLCTDSPGPNINLLTNGNPELEHKLKVLILEVDVMRQEGRLVPNEEHMQDRHWEELLKLPTISARRRYLEYLFKISKKKENRQFKKEQRRIEHDEQKLEKPDKTKETFEDFVHTYDLSHNNINLRFYESTMNQMYNNRLMQAMQFGQKLVVDCGYHEQMTTRENINCAKQLMLLFAENRFHDDPYDLYYCNFERESSLGQALNRFIATLHDPSFPLNVHSSSYTDIFPKEKLVYLTPHCREELLEYDHDAVYIIGGIVDKVNNEPLSLAKAKKEGIRMAKFPLDRYLQWGAGSGKSLTLNQVTSILLDVKHTNDWKYSLRHVPRRKIVDETENKPQDKRKLWKPQKKMDFSGKQGREKFNLKTIMFDEEEEGSKKKARW